MDFERWLLTEQDKIYRFSRDTETIAYFLFHDTFTQADKSFGEQIFDEDFEPSQNWIQVKCATLGKILSEDKDNI